jgi:hypothetical protein
MPKYNSHTRLPLALFEHAGYKGLAAERKAQCLAILVVLIRFANPKTGSCYPRYSKIKEMIGLSRMTLYRCIKLLVDAGLLIKKRLSSTNLYTLSPILMVNSVSNRDEVVSNRYISGIHKIPINKYNINKIVLINNVIKDRLDKIVNDSTLNKQNKVLKISDSVPLPELQQCIKDNIHPYYCRLAVQEKMNAERETRLLPKHVIDQTIKHSLSKTVKSRSAAYKAKVEYNKRNGLDWQGKPLKNK